jgi:hypothetical protein
VAEPTVVTMTIAENPLAGQPGQNDLTITISSVPDLKLPADGSTPAADDVPIAILAATEMVAHVCGLAHEAVLHTIKPGSSQ